MVEIIFKGEPRQVPSITDECTPEQYRRLLRASCELSLAAIDEDTLLDEVMSALLGVTSVMAYKVPIIEEVMAQKDKISGILEGTTLKLETCRNLMPEFHGWKGPGDMFNGLTFGAWLTAPDPRPYHSYGNGAAMRVSPCGFAGGRIASFFAWCAVMAYWFPSAVLMRTESWQDTLYVFKKFFLYDLRHPSQFRQTAIEIGKPDSLYCFFFIAVLMIFDYFSMKTDVIQWISERKVYVRWAVYLIFIWVILAFMQPVKTTEFVYFQF